MELLSPLCVRKPTAEIRILVKNYGSHLLIILKREDFYETEK